jgi:hypothetical protein
MTKEFESIMFKREWDTKVYISQPVRTRIDANGIHYTKKADENILNVAVKVSEAAHKQNERSKRHIFLIVRALP